MSNKHSTSASGSLNDSKDVVQHDDNTDHHYDHDKAVAEEAYGHHDARRGSVGVTTDDVYNPLAGLSKQELFAGVDQFCQQYGFESDNETFRNGALAAQNPRHPERITELDQRDRDQLVYERDHPWKLPGLLYYSVMICAIGAATQGWDQTGSNGANLSFPAEFGIGKEYPTPGYEYDEWVVGVVNAAPYIAAAFVGCWISDPLNHYLGRRGEIFLTGLILIATPIGSGFTKSWHTLLACRLIMGIGVGAKAATVPMYCAELSPARIRGALTMGWQLWTAFGIFLGFCANAVFKDVPRIAWRLQLGSACLPAIILTIGIYFCPESPRWLMKKGRMTQAWINMQKLRHSKVQAARDLYYAYVIFSEESAAIGTSTYFSRLADLFRVPRVRRATLAASTVMLAQQMCGINIMAFYSSTIFVKGGASTSDALYASIGFGALNFVFAIPAVFTIDTFGRRSLLLATFPNMCWTLLAAGMSFFIDQANPHSKKRTGVVAFFIYLFTIAYSVGEGPVPFMYSAEVFPLKQREQGMAWAVAFNNFWGSILSLTFPSMLRAMTPQGAFGFYAAMNAVAFVLIFLFVPETKQLTLEELDSVFSVPTKTFIHYETSVHLPWWIKKHVFHQKDAYLAPLVMPVGTNNPNAGHAIKTHV